MESVTDGEGVQSEPSVSFPLQGSATLSMAYAAALFADSVLRGLNGKNQESSII